MKIIEIFANRRSGHHFFMSWLVSNVSGEKDTKIKELNKITWINDEICHYNDATYHAFFDKQKVLNEIEDIINKKPKYLFINYEESDTSNELNKEGTLIYKNNPLKIVFIRDFLNTFASKWKVSETDLREFYFGFKNEKEILQNIEQWKMMAKNYTNKEYGGIKYEDLLNNKDIRENFLINNFGIDEKFKPSEFEGTKSSFKTNNFNNRYLEVNFSDKFKELIKTDSELNYLIGLLQYEYKKL